MTTRNSSISSLQMRDLRVEDIEFAAGIAHDLKTPLSTIATSAELLEQEIDATTFSHLIKVIQRQTVRLNMMIGELSDRLKSNDGEVSLSRETFDLGNLLAEMTDDFRRSYPERVIECETPPSPVTIWADYGKSRRIFENLLRNALSYSPADTSVRVRLRVVDGEPAAQVEVEDDGPGVPSSMRNRIFDAFVRLNDGSDGSPPGQGLGLHVVKILTEAHGGFAFVEPTPSGGSRFCIRLPLDTDGSS